MNVRIDEYSPTDVPQLASLWADIFGDDCSLIGSFFELLPSMGTGMTAKLGEEVIGAAYLLDAELCGEQWGYLYAVAVKPEHRGKGIGAELCRKCASLCKNVVTLPAEIGLYAWYEHILGTETALFTETEYVLPTDAYGEIVKINASEYAKLREMRLKNRPHFSFCEAYMEFQQQLCEAYGGGMYRSGEDIFCGYVDDGVLHVKEATDISPIPVLCKALGTDKAEVRMPAVSGTAYIAANHEIPCDAVYGLTLD